MKQICLPVVACLFTLACIPNEEVRREMTSVTHQVDLGRAERVNARITFPAGEFTLHGGAAKLLEGQYRFDSDGLKPVVSYRESGGMGELSVEPAAKTSVGNSRARWETRLNDRMPLDLVINVGAGDAEAAIGSLNLRKLHVNFGAGKMTLDLRGKPTAGYDAEINGGVGEGRIYWPGGVGVEAEVVGGIGEITTDGDIRKDGRRYHNALWDKATTRVRLHVRGGVGTIKMIAAD